mmetsp:Transcript_12780/g.38549  ORF Transcript_12780/g.38549 Transcript_12780/m.38549 type:complete len:221 (-) Transcript_12780:457-1119(-)
MPRRGRGLRVRRLGRQKPSSQGVPGVPQGVRAVVLARTPHPETVDGEFGSPRRRRTARWGALPAAVPEHLRERRRDGRASGAPVFAVGSAPLRAPVPAAAHDEPPAHLHRASGDAPPRHLVEEAARGHRAPRGPRAPPRRVLRPLVARTPRPRRPRRRLPRRHRGPRLRRHLRRPPGPRANRRAHPRRRRRRRRTHPPRHPAPPRARPTLEPESAGSCFR